MARIVPYAAIQFTAHEQWKRVLNVSPKLVNDTYIYSFSLNIYSYEYQIFVTAGFLYIGKFQSY